jgi:hypothetical protein
MDNLNFLKLKYDKPAAQKSPNKKSLKLKKSESAGNIYEKLFNDGKE